MSPVLRPAELDAADVWKHGRIMLNTGLAISIMLVFGLVWVFPDAAPFLPVLPIGMVTVWFLFRDPARNLVVLLACFPLVADFEEGIDIGEALFGLYYMAFLAYWYFQSVILERRKLIESPTDRLIVFILALVVLYVPISFLFDASPTDLRGELLAFTMLGFYFPIKWFVFEQKHGVKILFAVLIWTGLVITVRNIFQLQELLSQATMVWQVTRRGRVATNEILIVLPAFVSAVWALHNRTNAGKVAMYLASFFFMLGIVLTQSRGYWLSFSFGILVLFFVLARRAKVELVVVGLVGVSTAIALVFAIFGDTAVLLVAGLLNRIISLATATTQDPSLINRFLETRAVASRIADNPILGYGMGVSYSFHDLTVGGTKARAFIHNGYLSLWYRFGLVGFLGVMSFWLLSIRNAVSMARVAANDWDRYGAMIAAAGLSSLLVSGITSTPFYQNDLMLMIALMTGMTAGIVKRSRTQLR